MLESLAENPVWSGRVVATLKDSKVLGPRAPPHRVARSTGAHLVHPLDRQPVSPAAARMRVVTTLAGARSPWLAFGEEVLDVEMVHALAPDATLVILLLPLVVILFAVLAYFFVELLPKVRVLPG
jgi:hypothetical protein